MSTGYYSCCEAQKCRQFYFYLAFCITVSSGFGVLIAHIADQPYFLLMRMAAVRPVSIVGSVMYTILPFLFFLFLIVHSKLWLVLFFCSARLMLLTAAGFAIRSIFPYGNWLVRLLLQFPDVCLIPWMLYLCIRRFTGGITRRALMLSIPAAVLIGLIYTFLISPFTADLMNAYETMGRYTTHAGLDRCL